MSLNKLLIATALMVSVSGLALADSTMPAATTPASTTPAASTSAPAKTVAEKTPAKKHVNKHARKSGKKGPKVVKAGPKAASPKAVASVTPAAR